MANVVIVQLPGGVHHCQVFGFLLRSQKSTLGRAVGADRHGRGCAVTDTDAGAGQADLQHVARKVGGGMRMRLVVGGDVNQRGVVVGAEGAVPDPSVARPHQWVDGVLAQMIDDGLRRLNHQVETNDARFDAVPLLQLLHQFGQRRDLLRHGHLGQRDDKISWHFAAAGVGQRGDGQIQRAHGPLVTLQRKRLDADADKGRQCAGGHPFGQLLADGDGVEVLFLVGPVAIAVLEIDAVVFHRLAQQLFAHAPVNRVGHPGRLVGAADGIRIVLDDLTQVGDFRFSCRQCLGAWQAQRPGERNEVRRISV